MRNLYAQILMWVKGWECLPWRHHFVLITENTNHQPFFECTECFLREDQ